VQIQPYNIAIIIIVFGGGLLRMVADEAPRRSAVRRSCPSIGQMSNKNDNS
jgi:hypothetical protein